MKLYAGGLEVSGYNTTPQEVTPKRSYDTTGNKVYATTKTVTLQANDAGTTDWFILPDLGNVEVGHEIIIVAGAANCEMRTPFGSNDKINDVDCDGNYEYVVTATNVIRVVSMGETAGWMAKEYTKAGADVTAVTPDEATSASSSASPSKSPSSSPSKSPSSSPSASPSASPSESPSKSPSASPSKSPSSSPSASPSASPSQSPSASTSPSASPSASPSG